MPISTPYFAGVDLGGTKTAVVLGDGTHTILAETTFETRSEEGPDAVLTRISQAILQLQENARVRLDAITLGVPGLCNLSNGTVLFCPNLAGCWRGVDATQKLSALTCVPVWLLNDARAAAWGEYQFGGHHDSPDLMVATVGTGIGGGLILDGRLRLGRLGAAGELGHQTLQPDGPLCGCGNRGCVESLASGPAIAAEGVRLLKIGLAPRLRDLVQGNAAAVTPSTMGQAADAGDTAVADAIDRAARWLGIGIAGAVTTTGVERVVLMGGVTVLGDRILTPVREEIQNRVRMFPAENVKVTRSQLADRAGLLGALAWASAKKRGDQ